MPSFWQGCFPDWSIGQIHCQSSISLPPSLSTYLPINLFICVLFWLLVDVYSDLWPIKQIITGVFWRLWWAWNASKSQDRGRHRYEATGEKVSILVNLCRGWINEWMTVTKQSGEVQIPEQARGRFAPVFDKQSLRKLINEHPCEVVLERSLALLWSL